MGDFILLRGSIENHAVRKEQRRKLVLILVVEFGSFAPA